MSIQHQHRESRDSPFLPHTPATAVYGTSPGSGRTDKHQSSDAQARKLLKRVQWDEALDEKEWTVRLFLGTSRHRHRTGIQWGQLRGPVSSIQAASWDASRDARATNNPLHPRPVGLCSRANCDGTSLWTPLITITHPGQYCGYLGDDGRHPAQH